MDGLSKEIESFLDSLEHKGSLSPKVMEQINSIKGIDKIKAITALVKQDIVQVMFSREEELGKFYVHCFIPGQVTYKDIKGDLYAKQWKFGMTPKQFDELFVQKLETAWGSGYHSRDPPLSQIPENCSKVTYDLRFPQGSYGLDHVLEIMSKNMQNLYVSLGLKQNF